MIYIVRKYNNKSNKAQDVFVVILCLLGVAVCLYLFQKDLFMSLRPLSANPAGTVKIKHNTVQRRHSDRVIWDRLYKESPVYPGDLIRIAKLSDATLDIERNEIDLDENTLIRVNKHGDSFRIDLISGNVNITSGLNAATIAFSFGDTVVETIPGTVINAKATDKGMTLKVNEGSVLYSENGYVREIAAPFFLLDDPEGEKKPLVVVTQPKQGARYLKSGAGHVNVNFSWRKFNVEPSASMRLDIAGNRNFSGNVRTINNLDSSASAAMNSGDWHWRLSYGDVVLDSGRFTVVETAKPVLLSPEMNRQFRYRTVKPEINFRWTAVDEAESYILQVSESPNFNALRVNAQIHGVSFISTELELGTWHWRVQPVYSSVMEGNTVFSDAAVFSIRQNDALEMPELSLPAPDSLINVGPDQSDLYFSWKGIKDAVSYTIMISTENDLSSIVIERTVRDNFFVYGKDEKILLPGRYYWSVFYIDEEGYASPYPRPRLFMAIERDIVQRLVSPHDGYSVEEGQIKNTRFEWRSNLTYEKRFQVSASPDFSRLVVNELVGGDTFQGVSIPAGDWYWRVCAKLDAKSPLFATSARRVNVTKPPPPPAPKPAPVPAKPAPAKPAPAPRAASPAARPAPAAPAKPAPAQVPRLSLLSPAPGTALPGLTALRQPTAFRWETSEDVGRSRFIISRNANPAVGRAEVEIQNPGRTVAVPRLGEGLWYWTVEAYTKDGRPIIAGEPRQLRVQPIPLLPAPENLQPQRGYSIGAEQLRQQREINFNWSAVEGASSYIFTIIRESDSRQYQILQTEPLESLSYTFNELELLDLNGEYLWQVEAVRFDAEGGIEQRGRPGESNFTLDIPPPRVQTGETGVLYGF